jgi:F0F1-type ATP synthase gamma subunit
MTQSLEEIVSFLDISAIKHPFVDSKDAPPAVLVVSSDAGLVGGMNYKMMTRAADFVREHKGQMLVIGLQGKKFAMKTDLPVTYFPGVIDTECARQADEVTQYILNEVRAGKIGAVKVLFPYAASIGSQFSLG